MKFAKKQDKRTGLRKALDDSVLYLDTLPRNSKEYECQLKTCERLFNMWREEELSKNRWKVSPDVLTQTVGNILGIGLILNFERLHSMTTKAFNILLKGWAR